MRDALGPAATLKNVPLYRHVYDATPGLSRQANISSMDALDLRLQLCIRDRPEIRQEQPHCSMSVIDLLMLLLGEIAEQLFVPVDDEQGPVRIPGNDIGPIE